MAALLFGLCIAAAPATAQVSLGGTLDQFGALAGTAVSNTGPSTVTRNVGVSPGSSVTGFPPGVIVGGTIHAGGATAAEAQAQLTTAYDAAAGTPCDADLTGQDLGNRTLTPGVYCFTGGAQLNGALTLDLQGNPDAFFLFRVGGSLATASGSSVVLSNAEGGDCAPNLFWRVGSSATVGSGASFGGSILAQNSVTLTTGASLSGRALARVGNIILDTNTITPCSRAADLSVTGTDSPDPVAPGQNVTYDVTATNDGPDPARGAVLTATLPSSLRLQSFVPAAGWSCSAPAVGSSGAVTCSKQSAAVGSAAFTLTAQVDPGITADTSVSLPLEVSASTSDPDTADRSTTLTTQVLAPVANLAVTLADTPDPVAAGENLVYTADVTNNGPRSASDVALSDTLPAGVTFVSATPSQGTCMYTTVLNCSLGALANGAKARVTVVVQVAAAAAPGSTIANSVSVTSSLKDTDASDSTAGTGTLVATPTPPTPDPPPDATAGAPTACLAVTPAIRKRTKLVPGGGEVLLTLSQTADAAAPLKLTAGARRGVKTKSVAFRVNKKAVASTSTSVLVPFAALKVGGRNAISVVITLTNNKKVTVNDFVGLTKCSVPPVTCERLAGGTQLKCSSSMPLRARSVSVTVFGADGKRANGKAKVNAKKGAKKATYTLTMKTPVTFLPGRYVYKHVATTTRRGEKLLAVRVLNLK
jgi:uncharacterized repeat protein (TIGR01451 family)